MICPNCNTENSDTNRFCLKCGNKLIDSTASAMPQHKISDTPRVSHDPLSQIALIVGITGILGGGLTILGWLIPWFSFGSVVNTVLRELGIGSRFSFLNFSSGVGSGLQMSLFLLIGSIAAFSSSDVALFGLLGLVMLGVLVSIPILGVQNLRSGIRAFELRMTSSQTQINRPELTEHLNNLRSRSKSIFVIMAIIFLVMAVIPFGTSVLGGGFYMTAIGAICSYLGAYFNQSKLFSLPK